MHLLKKQPYLDLWNGFSQKFLQQICYSVNKHGTDTLWKLTWIVDFKSAAYQVLLWICCRFLADFPHWHQSVSQNPWLISNESLCGFGCRNAVGLQQNLQLFFRCRQSKAISSCVQGPYQCYLAHYCYRGAVWEIYSLIKLLLTKGDLFINILFMSPSGGSRLLRLLKC